MHDCIYIMILQILCFYLYPDTLLHLYNMTRDRFYAELASKKLDIPLIYDDGHFQDNNYEIYYHNSLIKVVDIYQNIFYITCENQNVYMSSVIIHSINKYCLTNTLQDIKKYFIENYINTQFEIIVNNDTRYEFHEIPLVIPRKMTCSLWNNGQCFQLI